MNAKLQRAVVIGSSIAGLVTARVLTEHVDEVVLLDRDELPDGATHRKGVPQSRHVHALQAGGLNAIDSLLPGLADALRILGAPTPDLLGAARWCLGGARYAQRPSGIGGLAVSRPRLETEIRRRVREFDAVRIIDRCDVLGLVATPDGRGVAGVRLMRRTYDSAEETLRADLVVDASGRASRTPVWLTQLGYPSPPVEEVRVGVTYASRRFMLRPDALDGDRIIVIGATTGAPRAAALIEQEDGCHHLSMLGMLGEAPGQSDEAFLDFAGSLATPDIYWAIRDARPLDAVVRAHFPANLRRRYDRMRAFPDGLVVVGDAMASFNPTYGQGMTVAALEALALGDCLAHGTTHLARRYFRAAHRIADNAWMVATANDLRHPGVEGDRSRRVRLVNAYLDRVHAAAHHDADVAEAFVRVAGFLDPPQALFRPSVLRRVLVRTRTNPEVPAWPASLSR